MAQLQKDDPTFTPYPHKFEVTESDLKAFLEKHAHLGPKEVNKEVVVTIAGTITKF